MKSDESTCVGEKVARAKVVLPEPAAPIRTTSAESGIESFRRPPPPG
jgi:hypothetical protein